MPIGLRVVAGGERGLVGVKDAVGIARGAVGGLDGEFAKAEEAGAHEANAGEAVEVDGVTVPGAAGGGAHADVAFCVDVAGALIVGGVVAGEGDVGEEDDDVAIEGGTAGLLVGAHAVGGDLDVAFGAERV